HINAQAIVAFDPVNNSITMATDQIITLLPDGTFQIQGDADLETVYFNYLIEDAAGYTGRALVEVVQIPSVASGTTIETTEGHMLIENITAGMYVNNRDDGQKMVRWIGNSTVST
ncbi:MAG: 2,3,4,5-tetrahydropyridine-2,6-carboxylate N-succinyltransferase, partial [Rhodobacteraceae bacterium]|nr:2,3,4,5-tetrahydropyridine-2,6-carboxylate N-succinyltransferase [Paracoccaceae bacterium]